MPLFPEQVPEHDRELVGLVIETEAFGPRDKCLFGFAHLGHAGEIALSQGDRKSAVNYLQTAATLNSPGSDEARERLAGLQVTQASAK